MIKLKDVAEIIDSLHATPKYSSNGYPMVRVMDVNNSFLHLEKCCKVDEQTCNKHNKNHIPQKGDIIITRVGSYGMLAYIDTSEKFCLGQNIAIISPRINGKYLYYYLQSPYLKNIIYGKIGGSSYKCIGLEDIKNLPYESFNLNCDRIGEILYKIDSKIEINNAISAQLQSLAKLIYDYWFLQFEFPNEEGKPYKSSGGKMIWNEDLKRDIPEGWEASKLCKMFDIIMGSSPKGESLNENYDGIEFYQGSTDFGNLYPIQRVYTTAPVRLAKAQDVLISVRAPVGDMNIAMNDCCIGRGLAAIRYKSALYTWNTMLTLKAYFDVFNGVGTTFGALTSDGLKQQRVVKPSNNIVEKYIGKISAIEQKIRNITIENQQLTSLRDFLLPLLMNGQVTFKDDKETTPLKE